MPSKYLSGASELERYGVAADTSEAQIIQASVLVDTYLRRVEGLEYIEDAAGNPVAMKSLVATGKFKILGGITPGKNIVADLFGPVSTLTPGTILVVDKETPALAEPLVIISRTNSRVIFKEVKYAHSTDAFYESGLVIFETKQLPSNRPLMLLSKAPVLRLLHGQGRYGYSRRGGSNNYTLNEFNLLAVMTQFGGPPVWENINIDFTDYNPQTCEVWIPAGIMLAYYSEVRMSYLAGYTYDNLPSIIKQATANIVNSQVTSPLNGNLKLIKAGDTQMERFLDTVLDTDTRLMLNAYRARVYG